MSASSRALPERVPTLILGLGTAGSAAARALTRAGIPVLGLDAKPLDQAGARWRNGVPTATLDAHGLPVPDAPLAHPSTAFHLVAGWGPERLVVRDHELVDLDMPWLVARLQAEAIEAGADLRGGHRIIEVQREGARHRVILDDHEILADQLIDAAGLRAPTGQVPDRTWLCTAAQEDRALADPAGAERWLADHALAPGETVSFAGVAGGFSIVNCAVHLPDAHGPGEVHLLTGSIPGLGHAAGKVLLDRFVADHPWIGATRSGGARAIPLCPPHAVPGRDGLIRLGDAAAHVYAIHGSGIAAGLDAAALLAEVLGAGGDAWSFTVAWQRRHGGRLAAAAAFARFTAGLSLEDLRRMIRAGLMQDRLVRDGLHQASPSRVDPRALPGLLLGAVRAPRDIQRMAPVLNIMRRLEAMHRDFPDRPDRLDAWEQRRTDAFAALPEPAYSR